MATVTPPSGTQEGSHQDSDVQGWRSLFVSGEPWRREEACSGGTSKEWVPQGVHSQADGASQQDSETRAILLYISGLSELIRWILSPLAIHTSFHPLKTLKQGLVHPRPWSQCPKEGELSTASLVLIAPTLTYIRKTGRTLDLRLQEHSQALMNGNVTASAVAEHVFQAGHQIDLSKASVTGLTIIPTPKHAAI